MQFVKLLINSTYRADKLCRVMQPLRENVLVIIVIFKAWSKVEIQIKVGGDYKECHRHWYTVQ